MKLWKGIVSFFKRVCEMLPPFSVSRPFMELFPRDFHRVAHHAVPEERESVHQTGSNKLGSFSQVFSLPYVII